MELTFQEYQASRIVNVHRHVDPWFWDKYSAHPYVGCRSGCTFCFLRGGSYLGQRNPVSFDTFIRVKINGVERLRKELSRLEPDVITCGDWQQPAEDRYRLSRGMLEVVRDLAFPLFVVERSPLLLRDLDLLIEINRRAWVSVVFSLSNMDPALKQAFEPHSPGVRRRLQVMEKIASAGILVGTALMPIIPFVGDSEVHLENAVRATRDAGGTFILASGLTMEGVQAEYTLQAARQFAPSLEANLRQLYDWREAQAPNNSPSSAYAARLGRIVRELCVRYDLKDRMPRHIAPGPRAANKWIAEQLFLKTYDLELEQAQGYRIQAYRKAAWTVDEWTESILDLYRREGEQGLRQLPGIGESLAAQIAQWLNTGFNEQPIEGVP